MDLFDFFCSNISLFILGNDQLLREGIKMNFEEANSLYYRVKELSEIEQRIILVIVFGALQAYVARGDECAKHVLDIVDEEVTKFEDKKSAK